MRYSPTRYRSGGLILAVSLALASLMTPAQGAYNKPTLLGPLNPLVSDQDYGPEERFELAEALLAATEAFSSEFPTLSPTEREYVERELSEGASDRLDRLINSSEFQIYEIRNAVNGVERTLEGIVDRGPAQDQTRLREWALVAYYLNDVDSSRFSILAGNGTVQEHSFPVTAGAAARQVLRYAVIEPSF